MMYDVIIVGAGPVGLCLASSLAPAGLKIALIEKQPESVLANPSYDGREIALTHHSHKIMQDIGLWDLIPRESISLIRDARVLNGESSYALCFDHEDAGRENLGFMISNHLIRKAAYDSLRGKSGIELMTETEVTGAGTDDEKGWVELADGRTLKARLIVAADSRFSPVRKMMGVETAQLDFQRTCIVCRMSHDKSHDYIAYECFHYDRTLAALPLNNNHCSLVITLPTDQSAAVLDMNPEDFSKDIAQRLDNRLGDMKLTSKLYPYPLVATYADKFYGPRFALVGDAAVGMHPVTAHGFNFGLRGQHTLAGKILSARESGMDIGAASHLRRYSQQHRRATRALYLATNSLVSLYTRDSLPARMARHALLVLGNKIGPAKRLIMNQLTENEAA